MSISLTRQPLARRALLIAASAGLATAALPHTKATAQAPVPNPGAHRGAPGLRGAADFLDTMTNAYPQTHNQPRLPQSYADELGLFSTAFVYDSALAVVAAIAAGRLDLARTIGEGLLYAQTHDPVYNDGRLRQGYNVGPYTFYDGNRNAHGLVQADGTANIGWQFGFLGTAVGDMAWPGIALVQLFEATGEKAYLDGARRIGQWITSRAVNGGTLGGFSFGVNGADAAIPNVSTEHNIDAVSFFTMLHRADGAQAWLDASARALRLVESMWNPEDRRQVDPDAVWLEGTAQLALALADRHAPRDRAQANHLLHELRRAQTELGGGQRVGGTPLGLGGLVAASSLVDSGFGFGYFQIQHVGATAWYVMAELGSNPMLQGGLR